MTVDGCGCGHLRTYQVRSTATSLTAFKVAIAGRSAAFAGLQDVGIHSQAHRTARFPPFETGVTKYSIDSFRLSVMLNGLRSRHDHGPHRLIHSVTFHDAGGAGSSMRELVHDPMKTRSIGISATWCAVSAPWSTRGPLFRRAEAKKNGCGHRRHHPRVCSQVTNGARPKRQSDNPIALPISRQGAPEPLTSIQLFAAGANRLPLVSKWFHPARSCRRARPSILCYRASCDLPSTNCARRHRHIRWHAQSHHRFRSAR